MAECPPVHLPNRPLPSRAVVRLGANAIFFPDVASHCDGCDLTAGVDSALSAIQRAVASHLLAVVAPSLSSVSLGPRDMDPQALARFAYSTLVLASEKLSDDILAYCNERRLCSQEPDVPRRLAELVRRQVPRLLRGVLLELRGALAAVEDMNHAAAVRLLIGLTKVCRPIFHVETTDVDAQRGSSASPASSEALD
jgi:hypothetical protein